MGPQATQLLGIGHPLGGHHHDALEDAGDVPQGKGVVRFCWRGQEAANRIAVHTDHSLR